MANAVISINIRITNSTGQSVTLDGDLYFILGNPDANGDYAYGGTYLGRYIRATHVRFSDAAVTFTANEIKIFNGITWNDNGEGLGGKSPANAAQIAAANKHNNVAVYVGGSGEVVYCSDMPTSIVFTQGDTYDIVISGVSSGGGGGGGSSTGTDLTDVTDITPLDSSFSGLSADQLRSALAGKTLITNTDKIVVNFRKAAATDPYPYVGEIDGESVFFTASGVSRDGTIETSLGVATIADTDMRGSSQTRSSDSANFYMNSLNYKEQVAMQMLQAIIKHEDNPLNYDDSKIKLMVAKAFRIAVEFQNRAIMFRQEESSGGSSSVTIDTDSLNSNTEKILYNICERLTEGISIRGQVGAGGTVIPIVTEISNTDPIPVTLDADSQVTVDGAVEVSTAENTSLSIVHDGALDVNVLSMPEAEGGGGE